MQLMQRLFKFLRKDDSGAVTIEYVAIAVIVAALVATTLGTISTKIGTALSGFNTTLATP